MKKMELIIYVIGFGFSEVTPFHLSYSIFSLIQSILKYDLNICIIETELRAAEKKTMERNAVDTKHLFR